MIVTYYSVVLNINFKAIGETITFQNVSQNRMLSSEVKSIKTYFKWTSTSHLYLYSKIDEAKLKFKINARSGNKHF